MAVWVSGWRRVSGFELLKVKLRPGLLLTHDFHTRWLGSAQAA